MRISDWSSDVCSSDLKQKVKLCAALLTGIMIPLISRHGFQRAHALLDQPAVLAVGRDDPALAALATDQACTGVDGPQIGDFERLSLSGDRRQIGRATGRESGCRYV